MLQSNITNTKPQSKLSAKIIKKEVISISQHSKAFEAIEDEFGEDIHSVTCYLDFDASYVFNVETNKQASPEFYKKIKELDFEVTESEHKRSYFYHIY